MGRRLRGGLLIGVTMAISACGKGPLPPVGERIDGPYILAADVIGVDPGKMICYLKIEGGCDLRIGPPVVSLGWDEDFISAAVRKTGEPGALDYYYIVRDFDGPRADIARAVRGPFDEKKFVEERRKHGVPDVAPLGAGAD